VIENIENNGELASSLNRSLAIENIRLTSFCLWAIIPPTSSFGAFMPVPSSVFTILLITADTDVQAHFKHTFKEAAITVVRDSASVPKDVGKRPFDAVVVESRAGHDDIGTVSRYIDPSHTLVITGSRAVLRRSAKMMQLMNQPSRYEVNGKGRDLSLEGYLESKMGDFVKGMRNGSARNLHPMLISALERPLIASALRETQGNQIQAAELLGLNRNTLRKKITELHIPVKRSRIRSSHSL